MDVIAELWAAHQAAIIAVLITAASTVVATIKQKVDRKSKAYTFLDILTDVLAWVPRPGSIGVGAKVGLPGVNLPGFASLARADHAQGLAFKAMKAKREAQLDEADEVTEEHPATRDTTKDQTLRLIPLAILLCVSSCGATAHKIAVDVGACAASDIQAEVGNLMPAVGAILSGGAADWGAQLAALEKVGVPFVVCTVSAIIGDLRNKLPAGTVKAEADPRITGAIARASIYLNAHGVKP